MLWKHKKGSPGRVPYIPGMYLGKPFREKILYPIPRGVLLLSFRRRLPDFRYSLLDLVPYSISKT